MFRRVSAYSLVLIVFIASAVAESAGSSGFNDGSILRRTLSGEEFARAGLNKLSASELGALEAALAQHGLLPPPAEPARRNGAPKTSRGVLPRAAAPSAADFGAEQVARATPADTPNELRTRLEGSIDELTGRTVFVLQNGQVWQQRIPETASFARKLVNPEVVITRGLGGYKMVIVPIDRVVFVKRIQ